jgi:hypothetical protein
MNRTPAKGGMNPMAPLSRFPARQAVRNAALIGFLLFALQNAASPRKIAAITTLAVHVTWYGPTGNPTSSGEWPYDGSAGCSSDLPLGTVLELPDGRTVRCNDRGEDVGIPNHIDVFCADGYAACTNAIEGAYGTWLRPTPATVLRWGGA